MRSTHQSIWLAAAVFACFTVGGAVVGCSSDSTEPVGGGTAGEAGAAGTGGTAGTGGSGGSAGTAGGAGTGGTAGTAGTGGTGGTAGTGGSGGTTPAGETCTVEKPASASGYTNYHGTVLAPTTADVGDVLVDDKGLIACVGDCTKESSYANAVKVNCPDGVISPGLINAHDHVTYGNNPPYGKTDPATVKDVRYDHRHEWRKGAGSTKPQISVNSGATQPVMAGVELRFMMSGATSINGSNGATGLLRNLDKAALLEGLPIKALTYDTFPLGDSGGTQISSGCGYSFNNTGAQVAAMSFYTPHVAEGVNAAARNEFTCLSKDPENLALPNTAWIHGVGMIAPDIRFFANGHAKLIWSARTNVSLYGDTIRLPLFHKLGATIAMGTDWIASGSMNMSREFQCVRDLNANQFNNYFKDEDIWRMATENGAAATGSSAAIGSLKKAYMADISIFNGKTNKLHSAVTKAGLADVVLVLRGGRPMYGDSALLTSLGKGACEEMPVAKDAASNPDWAKGVCGVAKKACVADDAAVGSNLAAVKAAIEASYPLYFCGTPTNEPSCTPMRPGQYTGIATATDKDGDGVEDSKDNCPDVFNAIRPLDNKVQPDQDGDKVGDECDVCPFDANSTTCAAFDPTDSDGDGIKNAVDNCPDDKNADQADTDTDGHGNVCDKCPTIANPGAAKCPGIVTTIENLRKQTTPIAIDAANDVTLNGVVVTSLKKTSTGSNGFWISDPVPGLYKCIFIFTQATVPTVKVGDRINVTGTFVSYNTSKQLSAPTITVISAGTGFPDMTATVADLAAVATAEGYEGCRVAVTTPSTGVTIGTGVGILQGTTQLVTFNGSFAGTTFITAGTAYKEVHGIGDVFKGVPQLNPQTQADIVLP